MQVASSVAAEMERLGRLSGTAGAPYPWLVGALNECSAKVVAFADDADFFFVGRSPESVFDFLSGVLLDTSWRDRLSLLHFSIGSAEAWRRAAQSPRAHGAFQRYLSAVQLDPIALIHRPRPVALVDIVETGTTMGNLVALLHEWCLTSGCDWQALRRKLCIVGLTYRTKTSPNTWRWQQHAPWAALLAPGSIKNVSIPGLLYQYLGGAQTKVSLSHTPARWDDPRVTLPRHEPATLQALAVAVALFDQARQTAQRKAWVEVLRHQPAMKQVWCRDLVHELRV